MPHDALIIEDEEVLARNLRAFFERSGYNARTAGSAEAGLRLIAAVRPDIILLDHRLPGMDGLQLLAQLRQRDPGCKVVMLTGNGSAELAVRAMRLGAADFLTKPVPFEKLREVVDKLLGHETAAAAALLPEAPVPDSRSGAAKLLARLRRGIRRLFDDT